MGEEIAGLATKTKVLNSPEQFVVQGVANPYPFLDSPQKPDELGRLDEYRVLKLLGQGGMAYVFLAEDTHLRRRVALKVMKPSADVEMSGSKRFLREARMLASIKHEHVVTVYQVARDNPAVFIAMEWLQGQTLDDWIDKNGPPEVTEILRLAREIASGLAAIHSNGLIHRDLKPNNLWVEEPSGRIKLLDFGLVRALKDDGRLTSSGVIIGTPAFMSPEQARGEAIDTRSDLFSLGGVLYFLCSGQLPFPSATSVGMLTSVALNQPQPIGQFNARLPEPVVRLIMELLEKNPDRRPQSATEVIRRIQEMENSIPILGTAVVAPPTLGEINAFGDTQIDTPVMPTHRGNRKTKRTLAAVLALAISLPVTVGLYFGFVKSPNVANAELPDPGVGIADSGSPGPAKPPAPAKPKGILVLDDCDRQFKDKDKYEDRLTLFDTEGNKTFRVSGFNVSQTVANSRRIATDPQRDCIWVIENTGQRIQRFDLTGQVTGTINYEGSGSAVAVDPQTGNVWALLYNGSKQIGKTIVFSPDGRTLATHPISGWDIVYDAKARAFWIASPDLTKITAATGEVLFTIKIPGWLAPSVDVDPNSGSAWVGLRTLNPSPVSTNRLVKFDAEGRQLVSVELGAKPPTKISVDRADGSVWVAHRQKSVEHFTAGGKPDGEYEVAALTVQSNPRGGGIWVVTPEEIVKMTAKGVVTSRYPHAATTTDAWIASLD
ncbi:serine/threonine-protein kinase [Zavarzinella formosa]|uniref:serine/threonine-protein kinase n=1 Tax=Zavarzinella formosa TaxID=360055 RepID=UPI0002FEB7FA|nr:serine/threonine-protein kinase [Zavarzinella formosa]